MLYVIRYILPGLREAGRVQSRSDTYFLYYIPHNKSNLLVSLLQAYEGV